VVAELQAAKEKAEQEMQAAKPIDTTAAVKSAAAELKATEKAKRHREIAPRTAREKAQERQQLNMQAAAQRLKREQALLKMQELEAQTMQQQAEVLAAATRKEAEEQMRRDSEKRALKDAAVQCQRERRRDRERQHTRQLEAEVSIRRQSEEELFLAAARMETEQMVTELRAVKERVQKGRVRQRLRDEQEAQALAQAQALLKTHALEARVNQLQHEEVHVQARKRVAEDQARRKLEEEKQAQQQATVGHEQMRQRLFELELDTTRQQRAEDKATAAAIEIKKKDEDDDADDAIQENIAPTTAKPEAPNFYSGTAQEPQESERRALVQKLLDAQTVLGTLNNTCDSIFSGVVVDHELDAMWLLLDAAGDALSIAFSVGSRSTFEHFKQTALHALALLNNAEALCVAIDNQAHRKEHKKQPPSPQLHSTLRRLTSSQRSPLQQHPQRQRQPQHQLQPEQYPQHPQQHPQQCQRQQLSAHLHPQSRAHPMQWPLRKRTPTRSCSSVESTTPTIPNTDASHASNNTMADAQKKNSGYTVSSMRSTVPRFTKLKGDAKLAKPAKETRIDFDHFSHSVPSVSVDLSASDPQDNDVSIRNQAECGFGASRRGMSVRVQLKPVRSRVQEQS
jgi:hypothetical protein